MKLKDVIILIDECEVYIADNDRNELTLNGNEEAKVISIQIMDEQTMIVIVER